MSLTPDKTFNESCVHFILKYEFDDNVYEHFSNISSFIFENRIHLGILEAINLKFNKNYNENGDDNEIILKSIIDEDAHDKYFSEGKYFYANEYHYFNSLIESFEPDTAYIEGSDESEDSFYSIGFYTHMEMTDSEIADYIHSVFKPILSFYKKIFDLKISLVTVENSKNYSIREVSVIDF